MSAAFPPLRNDTILRAARGEPVDHAPVWIMRQAGRYLPEFRAARAMADFFTVCRTPELACEVTLQPLRRYPLLDAAIIFSDILVVPQALGLEVQMLEKKGPHFPDPLLTPADLARVRTAAEVDVHKELGYVFEAITLTRTRIDGAVPLLGFCGAPWTIMAYMIEGGGSKTLSLAKTWLFHHPKESHELLQRVTDVSVEYLIGQVKAGAQMLQIFESWAGELAPHHFAEFSLPYLKQIATRVKTALGDAAVPMTVFAKGAHYCIESLADSDYDVFSLDWTMDGETTRRRLGGRAKTLQGNMDPCVLYGPHDVIRSEVKRVIDSFGGRGARGYIANLGHGMLPDHDPEAVRVFLEAVREYSSTSSS